MAGRPARTYNKQLRADTVFSLEDLPRAIDDRDRWRERVRKVVLAVQHDDDVRDK